ncbi:hypothetical protein ACWCQK_33795 [Streptomyces sp. NPDC002306]
MVVSAGQAPERPAFAPTTPPVLATLATQAETATSARTMHTHVQIGTSQHGRSHVR